MEKKSHVTQKKPATVAAVPLIHLLCGPEEDVTADHGCPISFATTVDFLDRLQQRGQKTLI